jgi:hypothetical protein
LTKRRQQFASVVAGLVGFTVLAVGGSAWAQGAVRDQTGTLTVAPTTQATKSSFEQRFAGSFLDLSTYVGSGSFYTSGYRNPYVSNALNFRPSLQLNPKYKLSLNGRLYFEEEYTQPDLPNGRRWNLLDSWIFLSAKNLYTMPRAKVTFSGTVRTVIPLSFESRYSHLVTALGVGAGAARPFEFGKPDAEGKRWGLVLSLSSSFSKPFHSSETRGLFAGDTTNCRATGNNGATGSGGGSPTDDRCGGPLNTNFSLTTTGMVGLSRGKWSFTTMLSVVNDFKYQVDNATLLAIYANADARFQSPRGHNDLTWGIVSVGYDLTDRLGLAAGLASLQTALDSRYRYLRFPFYDFSGGANANNFTQVFVSVTGTL